MKTTVLGRYVAPEMTVCKVALSSTILNTSNYTGGTTISSVTFEDILLNFEEEEEN